MKMSKLTGRICARFKIPVCIVKFTDPDDGKTRDFRMVLN